MNSRSDPKGGFTLIELLTALVLGLVILGGTMAFAQTTWRDLDSNTLREDLYRDARFASLVLERDFQSTGVGLSSMIEFGALGVWGDSILILSVPYTPDEAHPYDLDPPAGTNNPLDPGGTCGPRCVDLLKDPDGNFDLQIGDLARLQVNDVRRLILVEDVTDNGGSVELTFTDATEIMHLPAGLSTGPLLDRFSTFVQKLAPVVYYVDGNDLYRADRFNLSGDPKGDLIITGVQSWEVKLLFVDGDEHDLANATDSDVSNDFDDLLGIRIDAELAADRVDMRVDGGTLFTRKFEWRFTPRNLIYERNR